MRSEQTSTHAGGPKPFRSVGPTGYLHSFLENLGERGFRIFVGRHLQLGSRCSLQELGDHFNVTRERIRQLEKLALERYKELSKRAAGDPAIEALINRVRQALGAAIPVSQAPSPIQKLLDVQLDEVGIDEATALLLLHLSGPYRRTDRGWLMTHLAALEMERIERDLSEGQIETLQQLDERFTGLGIRPEFIPSWREQFPQVRVIGGEIERWDGGAGEKAVQVLRLAGNPLTMKEIVERVADGYSRYTISNAVREDARVMRTGKSKYGLVEWELEEYSGIETEIVQELERCGGSSSIEDLVRFISQRFEVSENSVRQYINQSPRLEQTAGGRVKIRKRSTPSRPARTPDIARNCFINNSRYGCAIKIDSHVLRGVSAPIPAALGGVFGVKDVGDRREFSNGTTSYFMSRSLTSVSMSSVRLAAKSRGAEIGDILFAWFGHDSKLEFDYLSRTRLEKTSGLEYLALRLGVKDVSSGGLQSRIATAIGLEEASTLDDIRIRFRERREREFVELLPADHLSDSEYGTGNKGRNYIGQLPENLIDLLNELEAL